MDKMVGLHEGDERICLATLRSYEGDEVLSIGAIVRRVKGKYKAYLSKGFCPC